MKKILTFAVSGLATLIVGAGMASAMTVTNVLFDNGAGNVGVSGGGQVEMHAFVTSGVNENVQAVFVKFPGAGGLAQQGQCYTVNPPKLGESPVNGWDVSVPVTAPLYEGSWPVVVAIHGINGNGDATDSQCTEAAVTTSPQFDNRIIVSGGLSSGTLTTNSGGTGTGGTGTSGNTLEQLLSILIAKLTPTTPPAPTVSASCTAFAQAMSGTVQGSRNDANVRLQGFLLSQGESIPALAAGASFGFYGVQTSAAVAAFNAANHCN
jgi:hypothetical protein